MEERQVRGISRDAIKYMAMVTMLLNHIANVLMKPGSLLYTLMLNVGYFTAITMCYFLVEGFGYTRSKKKYAARLLIFAVVSQIPFYLATRMFFLNMIYTLFICFLILCVQERMVNPAARAGLTVLLIFATVFADWGLMAPIFTLLFWWSRGGVDKSVPEETKRKRLIFSYVFAVCLFGLFNYNPAYYGDQALLYAALSSVGLLLSAAAILFFYNGKKASWAGSFSKWFFYIFYPAHLLVLVLIRAWMGAA